MAFWRAAWLSHVPLAEFPHSKCHRSIPFLGTWQIPACRPAHREMDSLHKQKRAARATLPLLRFAVDSQFNLIDEGVDCARPNFLISGCEKARFVESVCNRGPICLKVACGGHEVRS